MAGGGRGRPAGTGLARLGTSLRTGPLLGGRHGHGGHARRSLGDVRCRSPHAGGAGRAAPGTDGRRCTRTGVRDCARVAGPVAAWGGRTAAARAGPAARTRASLEPGRGEGRATATRAGSPSSADPNPVNRACDIPRTRTLGRTTAARDRALLAVARGRLAGRCNGVEPLATWRMDRSRAPDSGRRRARRRRGPDPGRASPRAVLACGGRCGSCGRWWPKRPWSSAGCVRSSCCPWRCWRD